LRSAPTLFSGCKKQPKQSKTRHQYSPCVQQLDDGYIYTPSRRDQRVCQRMIQAVARSRPTAGDPTLNPISGDSRHLSSRRSTRSALEVRIMMPATWLAHSAGRPSTNPPSPWILMKSAQTCPTSSRRRQCVRGHEKVPTGGQVAVPAGGQ
jgi:hypothetical protein